MKKQTKEQELLKSAKSLMNNKKQASKPVDLDRSLSPILMDDGWENKSEM